MPGRALAAHGTLYVLIGDSNARNLVLHHCGINETESAVRTSWPWAFGKDRCLKCMACESGADTWVNIMHFGVMGSAKCTQRVFNKQNGEPTQDWEPAASVPLDTGPRIDALLPQALRQYAFRHGRVVVYLHSGLWEIQRMGACGSAASFSTWRSRSAERWADALMSELVLPARNGLAAANKSHASLLWFTMPMACGNDEDVNEEGGQGALARAPVELGNTSMHLNEAAQARLCADDVRVPVANLRPYSCRPATASLIRPDGLHWTAPFYEQVSGMLRRAAASHAATRQDARGGSAKWQCALPLESEEAPTLRQPDGTECEAKLCTSRHQQKAHTNTDDEGEDDENDDGHE